MTVPNSHTKCSSVKGEHKWHLWVPAWPPADRTCSPHENESITSHESHAGCIFIHFQQTRSHRSWGSHDLLHLESINYSHIRNSPVHNILLPHCFVSQLFQTFCCCRNLNTNPGLILLEVFLLLQRIRYFWSEESLPSKQSLLLNPVLLVSFSASL